MLNDGGGPDRSSPFVAGGAKPRPLAEVLAYTNPKVVWRFQEKFEITTRQANDLFREMLRWLWVCARSRELGGPKLAVFGGLAIVDEMWHEFLMFTRDYADFCRDYLGGFVHHDPATRLDREAFQREAARDPAAHRARQEAQFTSEAGFIHDELGARVLIKWFRKYRELYTLDFMNARRLPMSH